MHQIYKRKQYYKHVFTNIDDVVSDFQKYRSTDGIRIQEILNPFISKLKQNNINELTMFSSIFKDCGFNNKNKNQMIVFLLDKLMEKRISNRELNKFNDTYRNVIFNVLFNDFSKKIIKLIKDFITFNCPDIHNHDFLISKLKETIERKENLMKIEKPMKIHIENLNILSFNQNYLDFLNENYDEYFNDFDDYYDMESTQ